MSGIATAVVGTAVVGGIAQDRAASKAAKAQKSASKAGIANERDQFAQIQALLKPYVDAGDQATEAQRAFLGLLGDTEQRKAIQSVQSGQEYQTLIKQGEESILQNASATGGLRGGNTQAALSEFRPQLLNQLLNERFQKLGDVAARGQASAAGQANLQANSAGNISGLLGQIGSANAGRALATGQAVSGVANSVATLGALKLLKAF